MAEILLMLEPFARARVLVIDDNHANVALLESALLRYGLESVSTLTDAGRAVATIEELQPNLVLLDLHMPIMDGHTILAVVRQRYGALELPVAVLTADATREAAHRALSLGANDFLTKPLDIAEVVLRVRNLLAIQAMHHELRQRDRWLQASGHLTTELLTPDVDEPLYRIAAAARVLADADIATITGGAAVEADVVVGDDTSDELRAWIAESLAAQVIRDGKAVSLATVDRVGVGPTMIVPLVGRGGARGALAVCRAPGAIPFTAAELSMAAAFAAQATTALDLAAARADERRLHLLQDRDRIARDLHDHVIQRLFVTGMAIEALLSSVGPGPLAGELAARVAELDETIREIRSSIYLLRQPLDGSGVTVRARLMRISSEVATVLGFEPTLHFRGVIDLGVSDDLADDACAVLREALTNIARHAAARRADVDIAVTDGRLVLDVRDDGVGIGELNRCSGLGNLAARAEERGGSLRISRVPTGGTQLCWEVPLSN